MSACMRFTEYIIPRPLVVLDNVKVCLLYLNASADPHHIYGSFLHTTRSFSSPSQTARSVVAKSLKYKERKPLSRYSRAQRA
jgi:hypothetical protein